MENHPIPQDITGFQFKLIGKMTIKQFVYLAIGSVIAWIIFFIIDLPTLIKWPLSLFSLGAGATVAFIPVDGRPMDIMIRNFISALLSPTQFIYQKDSGHITDNSSAHLTNGAFQSPQVTPITKAPLSATVALQPEPTTPAQTQVAQEAQQVINTSAVQAPVVPVIQQPVITSATVIDSPSEKPKKVDIEQGNEKDELKEQTDPRQKQTEKNQTPDANKQPVPDQTQLQNQKDLESMLAESIRQKEELEKQILEMQAKQKSSDKEKYTPTTLKPTATTNRARKVPASMTSSVGLPSAPEDPNLITGIVKDPRGNPVSNILVEIKDSDSNSVRAFKTSQLGKFASATPLSSGKYVIVFEDPAEKHKFDDIEIELTGKPVMPLEIISVDPREELRRELFN